MLSEQADALRRDGATAIFIGIEEAAAGIFAIADPVRETTPDALAALRREGIDAVMLTGDNRTTAEAVARRLGISEVERSEEHTSELQSLMRHAYAAFCLQKKTPKELTK